VQTGPDTLDIDALVQNFRESKTEGEVVEEKEDVNDTLCHLHHREVQREDLSGCCQKFKGTAGICCTTE
jgi:hypothetical protein